jgi:hypothetical protein
MRRLFTSLVGAVVLAVGVPTVAQAAAPVVVEKHNTFTRLFSGLTDCQAYGYSFTYTEEYQVTRSVTDFYDDNGTLLREVAIVGFVGTSTNDTTKKSIAVNGQRHITFDFVNGTFTETGVLRHVTISGEGIVLHESGRIVNGLDTEELLFLAGPHELLAGDLTDYCAVLADP